MSHVPFVRRTLAGALILVGIVGGPATGADSLRSAAGTDIDAVRCEGTVGGYDPYLQFGCNLLLVTVADSTPSPAADYAVAFNGATITPLAAFADPGRVDLVVSTFGVRGDLVDGSDYPVTVTEDDVTSAPFVFGYDVVGAPAAAIPQLRDNAYQAGARTRCASRGSGSRAPRW